MTNLTTLAAAGLILAAGMAQAEGKYGTTAIQAPAPAAEAPAAQAAPAAGSLVHAADPQGVLAAMQALGHTATLGSDGAGDPMISGGFEGSQYQVFFYGCEANANCQWLVFSTGYDLPNGGTPDMVNSWNATHLVGQAYLDGEQDPMLNYFVTTTGGLTQENFADVVDWWRVAVEEFSTAVGGA